MTFYLLNLANLALNHGAWSLTPLMQSVPVMVLCIYRLFFAFGGALCRK